jgi:hypothetical protein
VTSVQNTHFSANSSTKDFCKKLFNKIDAEASYLGYTKSTYLFPVICEIKYAAYMVNSHYISCGGGENFLSQCHFIPEATSLWRVVIKNKNKADQLQHTVDSKPFVIFLPKILLHIG